MERDAVPPSARPALLADLPLPGGNPVPAVLLARTPEVTPPNPLRGPCAPEDQADAVRLALAHPRRRLILAYVQAHPGATFREVVRGVEVASGTARHHLCVLERASLVRERAHGSTVRFFETGRFEADWATVVLLREPPLRLLWDWLAAHPGAAQKEVLRAMGWSRSTTQHRLRRLVAGGAAQLRLQGRLKLYRAV